MVKQTGGSTMGMAMGPGQSNMSFNSQNLIGQGGLSGMLGMAQPNFHILPELAQELAQLLYFENPTIILDSSGSGGVLLSKRASAIAFQFLHQGIPAGYSPFFTSSSLLSLPGCLILQCSVQPDFCTLPHSAHTLGLC